MLGNRISSTHAVVRKSNLRTRPSRDPEITSLKKIMIRFDTQMTRSPIFLTHITVNVQSTHRSTVNKIEKRRLCLHVTDVHSAKKRCGHLGKLLSEIQILTRNQSVRPQTLTRASCTRLQRQNPHADHTNKVLGRRQNQNNVLSLRNERLEQCLKHNITDLFLMATSNRQTLGSRPPERQEN